MQLGNYSSQDYGLWDNNSKFQPHFLQLEPWKYKIVQRDTIKNIEAAGSFSNFYLQ